MLTDASLESDASEALSADSFTLDGSISNTAEKQPGNEPTDATYASRELAVSVTGKKTERLSPYISSGSTVLNSRFAGDAVTPWNCSTADLSVVASKEPVRLRKQPLFRWVYVLILIFPESSSTNAFSHLQGQQQNLSSFIVSRSPCAAVTEAGLLLAVLCLCVHVYCVMANPRAAFQRFLLYCSMYVAKIAALS